jgi:hypothetical protein
MTDRLAQLEAQAAALASEITALKAERPAPPPPVKDEVRIVEVLDERRDLPSLREMLKLFAIVKPRSPWPQATISDRRSDVNRPSIGWNGAYN